MAIELKVPAVGESISEVQIGPWLKRVGERALKDENLVEIETDKATVEVPAPVSGKLTQLLKQTGQTARVGEVIGYMEESPAGESAAAPDAAEPDANDRAAAQAQAAQAIIATAARSKDRAQAARAAAPQSAPVESRPAAVAPSVPAQPRSPLPAAQLVAPFRGAPSEARQEETVPMSPIRRRIAERLVEAQRTAALLTTFNEIDMSAVIGLRNEHKQVFQERYGIKLGFMSFFVKAAIDALKHVPQVNAEIRGTDIIYHNYFDIGIAVGGGKGLVVPVLRDADRMSFAQIEAAITDLAERARNNALSLEELQGGTFTISNGGVYGSLLSTPIVNPPQSGILGLHAIQDRPVARDGQVVIRPMMYVALTYDHRIVDGQGAVTFLKRVKDVVEQPLRMLMETERPRAMPDARHYDRSPELMSTADTCLLVVDVQQKLMPLIRDQARIVWNIGRLLDGARVLGVPAFATEQYPKGLGPTVPELAARLGPIPAKLAFSCVACDELRETLAASGRWKVLLAGIEAHVCVQQTALDLAAEGYRVYLAVDAIGARNEVDYKTALSRMESSGITLTSVEAALFEWCRESGTPQFKEISALVRQKQPD